MCMSSEFISKRSCPPLELSGDLVQPKLTVGFPIVSVSVALREKGEGKATESEDGRRAKVAKKAKKT